MPQINPSCATTELDRVALQMLHVRATIQYQGNLDASFLEFTAPGGDFIRRYVGALGLLDLYREHKRDINYLLSQAQGIGGRPPSVMPDWRNDDPLALTKHNRRLLAEFGLREAMKRVYGRHNGQTGVHQEAPNVGWETWQRGGSFDYGAVLSGWASGSGLAGTGRVPTSSGVSSEILPPTGPTGSPVGEH